MEGSEAKTVFVPPGDDDGKSILLSKTFWAGVVMAIVPLFPPAAVFIAANPAIYNIALGGLVIGLRKITSGKVTLF